MTRHRIFSCPAFWGVLVAVLFTQPVLSQPYRLLIPEVLDLGRILEGKSVEGNVRFVNTGKVPLRIEHVQTSCGCTAAYAEKTEFAPNDTASIHFTLRTAGFHGLLRKALSIYFENPSTSDLTVIIQADVFSELEVKPMYVSFQSMPLRKDTSVTARVGIVNSSGHPVRILKIRSDSDQIQVPFQPFSIPPNREIPFLVVLKPKKVEYRNAAVVIETDDKEKPNLVVPVLFDIYE